MTTEQVIATLREHNEWRRGGEGEMLDPKSIGHAIDAACDMMETMQRERDEAIAARKASAADWLNQICQANARVSRAFRERDEALEDLENHKAASMHTCHDNCKRPMCVLRRERDELLDRLTAIELRMPDELARLERERDAERALADRLAEAAIKSSNVIGPPDKETWSTKNEINDAWNCAQSSLSAWKEARSE